MTNAENWNELNAGAMAAALGDGRVSSEDLVRACLDRIDAVDGEVRAWAFLDPDLALAQARESDARRAAGAALGSFDGVPVGVKDIFDTHDMPTENGSILHEGRRPEADAAVVALLRAAGAVVMGKTVTTEFAMFTPRKTRNPHDPTRTPGGSSSGSAAAVAAFMVPLAIGSQTAGSVIRPAAFCGVYGYKPSHGLISRNGVLALSRPLDHVGVFARNLSDIARFGESLMVHDPRDPDMTAGPAPALSAAVAEAGPTPRLAFATTALADRLEPTTITAFEALAASLGDRVVAVGLPAVFDDAFDQHRLVMEHDIARSLEAEYERDSDALSPRLREIVVSGRRTDEADYRRALDRRAACRAALDDLLADYDAVLTPTAPGEAPSLETTGDPAFCVPWTFCGAPAISLPILRGPAGLPIGAQLVGRFGDDTGLLRTARWLAEAARAPTTP
jgi:Asp-tRNA(Asn)/Glu-tRNA(Gln) amidotransferase A subunit family amidase